MSTKKQECLPGAVAHVCNPSYSEGRDQEDHFEDSLGK
jgi:hypothetical protein